MRAFVGFSVVFFGLVAACTHPTPPSSGEALASVDAGGFDTASPAPDADRDGFSAHEDCDDGDPDAHPGAPEGCDVGAVVASAE